MPKYFIYVRKSTDVEDKQVRSIEDQLTVLRTLAKQIGLKVTGEFIEKQSAKRPGRVVFNDMLDRINEGEAQGIICWKLDRLARNPVDAAQISWMLQEGVIQHIQTHDSSFYSADNVMMMQVEFGMANQYIRDLSVNTKRGLYEKAKRGEYPGLAPLGYINNLRTRLVEVDQYKAPIVRQAFERYAKNLYCLEDISVFLFAQGIVTKKIQNDQSTGGLPLKKDSIRYILSNPFYIGLFRYGSELYEGNHKALISKELFDEVQAVLKKRSNSKSSVTKSKPLCGLFTCGECGRSISAETKTKRQKNGNVHNYLYYRCTKKNVICSQLSIRGEVLDRQLSNILKTFVLPQDWAKELEVMADKDEQENTQTTSDLIQDLRLEVIDIERKLEHLFQGYLEQVIEQEKYRIEKNKLILEKKTYIEKISSLEQNQNIWLAPLRNWLEYSQNLAEIAISADQKQKKSAAQKIFGSHLYLRNKEIEFTPQIHWAALSAAHQKIRNYSECNILVGPAGFEPATNGLKGHCSTN
jgi:site-specific DNA recombinase